MTYTSPQPCFVWYFKLMSLVGLDVPCRTRSDRGSENVIVATMQNFLTKPTEHSSNHIFGSSITNQVIEQWWKGFRERHGEFFKATTNQLVRSGFYNEAWSTCRYVNRNSFKELSLSKTVNTFSVWIQSCPCVCIHSSDTKWTWHLQDGMEHSSNTPSEYLQAMRGSKFFILFSSAEWLAILKFTLV